MGERSTECHPHLGMTPRAVARTHLPPPVTASDPCSNNHSAGLLQFPHVGAALEDGLEAAASAKCHCRAVTGSEKGFDYSKLLNSAPVHHQVQFEVLVLVYKVL